MSVLVAGPLAWRGGIGGVKEPGLKVQVYVMNSNNTTPYNYNTTVLLCPSLYCSGSVAIFIRLSFGPLTLGPFPPYTEEKGI